MLSPESEKAAREHEGSLTEEEFQVQQLRGRSFHTAEHESGVPALGQGAEWSCGCLGCACGARACRGAVCAGARLRDAAGARRALNRAGRAGRPGRSGAVRRAAPPGLGRPWPPARLYGQELSAAAHPGAGAWGGGRAATGSFPSRGLGRGDWARGGSPHLSPFPTLPRTLCLDQKTDGPPWRKAGRKGGRSLKAPLLELVGGT